MALNRFLRVAAISTLGHSLTYEGSLVAWSPDQVTTQLQGMFYLLEIDKYMSVYGIIA